MSEVSRYSTDTLLGVVASLKRAVTPLAELFFGNEVNSEDANILFDVQVGKRRVAPLVHPQVEGQLVESLPFKTSLFTPAHVKDKRALDVTKPLRRGLGESLSGGMMTAQQREDAHIVENLDDMQSNLARRKEVWASEIIRTGGLTITGKGYGTVVLDFGRDAGQTIVLGGGSQWGDAGVSPIKDVESWCTLPLKSESARVTDVIFGTEAWQEYRDDPLFEKSIDVRRGDPSDQVAMILAAEEGIEFKGTQGMRRLWVYEGWYVDPITGVEVELWPATAVAGVSAALEGVQYSGAILDPEVGYRALPFVPKSWVRHDPAVRVLMGQAAPLLVPTRPNASFAATVK